MKKKSALWTLFFSTLYLSAFTFGGGYVIVSLMKKKFVDEYHWIEEDEMLDLIAIAQSAPGAIAVNGAIVVGYKLAGLPGVLLLVNAFWDGGRRRLPRQIGRCCCFLQAACCCCAKQS